MKENYAKLNKPANNILPTVYILLLAYWTFSRLLKWTKAKLSQWAEPIWLWECDHFLKTRASLCSKVDEEFNRSCVYRRVVFYKQETTCKTHERKLSLIIACCEQNRLKKKKKTQTRCTIVFDVYCNKGSNLNVKGYNCHKTHVALSQ